MDENGDGVVRVTGHTYTGVSWLNTFPPRCNPYTTNNRHCPHENGPFSALSHLFMKLIRIYGMGHYSVILGKRKI